MPSPNSKSHKPHGLAYLIPKLKLPDQTVENSETNASTPVETSISTRVPEKKQTLKLRNKKKLVQEYGGVSSQQRLSVSLSKEEIKEDLFILTGQRSLKCKKKRSNKMKKDLEVLFPGSALDGHDAKTLRKAYGPFAAQQQ